MADINVSLGLEDSKFKQGISNAQTQAQRLGTNLNTAFGGGINGISKLGQGIDALNVRFQNLGRAIVGIGLSAFVLQALRSAEAIQDVSGALGVATDRLLEMELASNIAGGNLDSLAGMVGRLEDNLSGAIEGNQKMRDSLKEVGIGYDEITQLSPDQVFNRIAKALAGMTDVNKRAALATELLGKSGRTFDWNAYNATINQVAGTQKANAEAVKQADQMMEQFGITMRMVSTEVLKLLSPLIGLATPATDAGAAMDRAGTSAKVLVGALGLFAASSIINALKTIAGAFVTMTSALFGSTVATSTETAAMAANTASLMLNARARAAGAAARVASLEASLATARAEAVLGAATITTDAATKAATRATWLLVSARAALAGETATMAAAEAGLTTATNANTAANVRNSASGAGILGWLGKYAKVLTVAAAAIGLVTYSSSLNKGEDEWADKQRKSAQLLKRRKDALATLSEAEKKRYNALSQDQKNAVIDSIVSQQEMKKQQKLVDSVYGTTKPSGGQFKETDEEKKNRIALAEAIAKQKLAMDNLVGSVSDKNQEQLQELKNAQASIGLSERDRTIKKEVLEFENRYRNDINNLRQKEAELISQSTSEDAQTRAKALGELPLVQDAIRKITTTRAQEAEAIRAQAAATYDAANAERTRQTIAQFSSEQRIQAEQKVRDLQGEMAKMTMTELEQKYYDINAAARDAALTKIATINEENRANGRALLTEEEKLQIMKAATQESDKLKNLTRQNYEASRSFNTGWKKAMNDYVANVGNAARQAETLFNKAMMGMEDAIVDFAKTGKFEWRGFVSMMLEELLRSQIQQLFGNMLGNMRNSVAASRSSFMPGESGGMPSGNVLGSLGGLVAGAIGSVGKLFGGFFADGGMLGAGKWGIAGERGPELISGPATITPLTGGGATYVTYNISAVDAVSFKQLVARDPSFIHAVASQGAKSIAGGRR